MEKKDEGWSTVEKKRGWKDREREKEIGETPTRMTYAEKLSVRTTEGLREKRNDIRKTYLQSSSPGFREGEGKVLKIKPTTYNGRTFAGFVSHLEATKNIYQEGLNLNTDNLHGVCFTRDWHDDLTITYKLKSSIDTGNLRGKFDYQRINKAGNIDWIGCIIDSPHSKEEDNTKDDFKRVKIDGCSYQLSQEELTVWLELYGRVFLPIEEELFEDEETGEKFGNGKYVVRMRIERELPELIPMHKQKIKIHYQGIKKMCKNCLAFHKGICQAKRRDWSDYVEEFIEENPRIPASMITKGSEEYYGTVGEVEESLEFEAGECEGVVDNGGVDDGDDENMIEPEVNS